MTEAARPANPVPPTETSHPGKGLNLAWLEAGI